ncbi:hypothetical protein AQUCO_00300393v1 [Aquilegia coerulea]|uniref:Uncharacterized protein n=1 Tax=Aquilegia coerulea TaxID=218851 RepID=A0A2G5EYJ9_AQUCA|nr:hypothetical protein AQUCO_00300393v1 [Aquilegia coerulea]
MVYSSEEESGGLEYFLRWQVPICALIIILPTIGAFVVISRIQKPHLNSSDLWIPCWKNLNPVWLLIYRALVFCIMAWVLYEITSLYGATVFLFYTQWTFALVIVYFALGTIISAHGCWRYLKTPIVESEERKGFMKEESDETQSTATLTSKTNESKKVAPQYHDEEDKVKQKAGFWGYLMLIIYQTCAGASMLTDIVFWGLLLPFQSEGQFSLTLLLGCMHGLNLLFLLLDTALNNLVSIILV